ncbi:MAG: hypothetical protein FWE95_10090 [Planctomycetaceae bacterium]|nr:hypothetical protein [Planctomycetaceae bacterium]
MSHYPMFLGDLSTPLAGREWQWGVSIISDPFSGIVSTGWSRGQGYQNIIRTMEAKYGKANRIWCSDRGMTSKENIEFLKQEDRKFIIGTAKGELRNFERELLAEDWNVVREGLEVKLCPRDGELFVLCRSDDRREKEKAMHERFVERMEKGSPRWRSFR